MTNDPKILPARVEPVDDLKLTQLGEVFARSGFFKDVKESSQAIVKVLFGRELDIGPIAAMTGIHIVEGKPEIGAHLIAAAIKKHPRYDYLCPERTDQACTVVIYEKKDGVRGDEIGRERFTMAEDAKRAGLAGRGTWTKHPKSMLFARAISNAYKAHCPDVFSLPVYSEGEIGEEPRPAPPSPRKGPPAAPQDAVDADFSVDTANEAEPEAGREDRERAEARLKEVRGACPPGWQVNIDRELAKALQAGEDVSLINALSDRLEAALAKAKAEKPADPQTASPGGSPSDGPASTPPAGPPAAAGPPPASPAPSETPSTPTTSGQGADARPSQGPGSTPSSPTPSSGSSSSGSTSTATAAPSAPPTGPAGTGSPAPAQSTPGQPAPAGAGAAGEPRRGPPPRGGAPSFAPKGGAR